MVFKLLANLNCGNFNNMMFSVAFVIIVIASSHAVSAVLSGYSELVDVVTMGSFSEDLITIPINCPHLQPKPNTDLDSLELFAGERAVSMALRRPVSVWALCASVCAWPQVKLGHDCAV